MYNDFEMFYDRCYESVPCSRLTMGMFSMETIIFSIEKTIDSSLTS